MRYRVIGAALAALCVTGAAGGCGSSSTPPNGAVVRAADTTAQAPGYRLAGTMTIVNPRTGTIGMTMNGSFDRADRLGALDTVIDVAGQRLTVSELLSRLTVYMGSSAIPGAAALTRGKPWIEIDMSRAIGAIGVSSLPTATDPTQFVDYLRAVSSNTTKVGTETIRGVQTTHYRATIDLDRYPNLVPAAQRPSVMRSVKVLETALGSHTMPLDVWIDSHNLVRRIALDFGECVSNTSFRFGMTMDLYDYGPQSKPSIPPASKVYNLTPLVTAGLRHAKLGCS